MVAVIGTAWSFADRLSEVRFEVTEFVVLEPSAIAQLGLGASWLAIGARRRRFAKD